jgi:8-oxo-dGTP diphosphatase
MAINKLATKLKGVKRGPVQAAGGIVVRPGRELQIAVVQMRKLGHWVLPKGKLDRGEDALTAARREVLEETGHQVSVHEYLGALSYEVRRGPKVVQFWRMQTTGGPVRKLMRDIKAVRWLPLAEAIEALTHPREQAFLAQVGPAALEATERAVRKLKPSAPPQPLVRPEPIAASHAEIAPPSPDITLAVPPSQEVAPPQAEIVTPPSDLVEDAAPAKKNLLEKFWTWAHGKD